MLTECKLFSLLFFFSVSIAYSVGIRNPDVDLRTPELVRKNGYPLETHTVFTEDGYILQFHRIPYGKNDWNYYSKRHKPPVLLMHGLAGSSADWILMGPVKSLGYVLADAGYDVWIGNNRGNLYSRNHTFLTPKDREFWNFSFHELGIYDLPAMIDYITLTAQMSRIFYIGHSQGATAFYIMASEKPEYNAKIILSIGLAPAAFTGSVRGPVSKFASLSYFGVWVGEHFGYPEYGPRSSWGKLVSHILCNDKSPTQVVCSHILFLIAGYGEKESNMENLNIIIGHVPAGASWKQFVHFGQGIVNPGKFRHFDYGEAEKNILAYNSTEPPSYKLNKVRAPIALFSSDGDWLSTTEDVQLLKSKLGNVVVDHIIPANKFNHYDFLWGQNAPEMVFYPVLELLAKYQQYF